MIDKIKQNKLFAWISVFSLFLLNMSFLFSFCNDSLWVSLSNGKNVFLLNTFYNNPNFVVANISTMYPNWLYEMFFCSLYQNFSIFGVLVFLIFVLCINKIVVVLIYVTPDK
jgi:hypothetical protein